MASIPSNYELNVAQRPVRPAMTNVHLAEEPADDVDHFDFDAL